MKIQQHDGVVVDAAVTCSRASLSVCTRGRGVAGERGAPRCKGAAAPPSPPLYRPPGGAPALGRSNLPGPAPPLGSYIKEGRGEGSYTHCLGASLPLLHLVLLP